MLWEIVTSPDGAQLRPPPLLRPAHPFPEMTTAERSRLSLGPPPRIAPPPNAWANPPEIVNYQYTATPGHFSLIYPSSYYGSGLAFSFTEEDDFVLQ